MYRLATKCTTKKRSAPKSQYTVIAFLGLQVGTVPFGATAEACAETAECRLQCTCREVCGLRICGRRSAV